MLVYLEQDNIIFITKISSSLRWSVLNCSKCRLQMYAS